MQFSLFPKSIVDDLGPVGSGATAPRWIRADDGLSYIVKDEANGVASVRASEYMWLSIARLISLPAPIPEIFVNGQHRKLVGTRREQSTIDAAVHVQALLSGRVLRGGVQLSRIFAFDLFCANWDRHPANYLVLEDGASSIVVFAIDFSHVTAHPGLTRTNLDPLISLANATRMQFPQVIQPYGPDSQAAIEVVDRLSSLPIGAVNAILSEIPDDWLPAPEKAAVSAWWASQARIDRATSLKQGFQNGTLI